MRAAYSTKINREVLEGIFNRLEEEFGLECEQSMVYENAFCIGNEENMFIVAIVGCTVYVNKLGSCVKAVLEKNGIQYSFSQHAKAPLVAVEQIFCIEESA